jgi:hypothetical protein
VGNWRTVNITGTIAEAEIPALRGRLGYSHRRGWLSEQNFGPLSFDTDQPSLCGLNDWVRPKVSAIGNLAERDYAPRDVRDELEELLEIAPSMMLVIHCGGDWESDECVATIRTGEGLAVLLPPEVKQIMGIPGGQAEGNLLRVLYGR